MRDRKKKGTAVFSLNYILNKTVQFVILPSALS